MKLSEIHGDEALEVLADLLEPAEAIMTDKEIVDDFKSNKRMSAVKKCIKKHKENVFEILSILNGKTVEETKKETNVLTLPIKLLEILNDKELISLFTSQAQNLVETSSSPAMEDTQAKEK